MAELIKSIQVTILPENTPSSEPVDSQVKQPEIPTLFFLLLEFVQAMSFKAGLEEGLKTIHPQKERLEALIHSIPEAISQQRWDLKDEIADIVFAIIQPLFLHNQTNPKIIEEQIHHILNQLNTLDSVELCLHPNDIALLQQGKITLNINAQGLKITSNPNLQPGGCIVKSNHGVFDASIEGQIERLKQTLLSIKEGGLDANPY